MIWVIVFSTLIASFHYYFPNSWYLFLRDHRYDVGDVLKNTEQIYNSTGIVRVKEVKIELGSYYLEHLNANGSVLKLDIVPWKQVDKRYKPYKLFSDRIEDAIK